MGRKTGHDAAAIPPRGSEVDENCMEQSCGEQTMAAQPAKSVNAPLRTRCRP